jgi:hypothetical protein
MEQANALPASWLIRLLSTLSVLPREEKDKSHTSQDRDRHHIAHHTGIHTEPGKSVHASSSLLVRRGTLIITNVVQKSGYRAFAGKASCIRRILGTCRGQKMEIFNAKKALPIGWDMPESVYGLGFRVGTYLRVFRV